MIGCGEIHERESHSLVIAVDLRSTGEIRVGSNPTLRIDCFENLQDPENNIKFDDISIPNRCIGKWATFTKLQTQLQVSAT